MSLRTEKTGWIFILGSHNGTIEDRFLYDVAYGVLCLEKSGIDAKDILLFIDEDVEDFLKIASPFKHLAFKTNQISAILPTLTEYDNFLLFVTGHGDESSIIACNPIRPHELVECVRSLQTLKNAIIFLGQCYAGIFNYLDVRKNKQDFDCPEVIIIGATNFAPSISSTTREMFFDGNSRSWIANLFFIGLFSWFISPKDVDGDSKTTVMDSFKWTSTMINRLETQRKAGTFYDTIQSVVNSKQHLERIDKQIVALRAIPDSPDTASLRQVALLELQKQVIWDKYILDATLHLNQQQPWILNAIPAQSIEY